MAGNIRLEVVTPERVVVDEETAMVIAPGTYGEFGVLIGHTPFLSTLKLGTLRYKDTSGNDQCVFISGGFAEALPDRVTVLAESAEKECDIDLARAKSALERARGRLEGRSEKDIDFTRARAALERALQRLRLAQAVD